METREIERLNQIAYRAELIFNSAYLYLKDYWNPSLSCFHTNLKAKKTKKPSMTNTSFALFSILESNELMERFSQEQDPVDHFFIPLAETLLSNKWDSEDLGENNIYTAPIVLVALYRLMTEVDESGKIKGIIKKYYTKKVIPAIKNIDINIKKKKAAYYNGYDPSAYLTYWSYLSFKYASEDDNLPKNTKKTSLENVKMLSDWAELEIFKQLAYDNAGDFASFDATQLAYALMIYVENAVTNNQRANQKILKKSIDLFFSRQQEDGLWPKDHPIFHFEKWGNVYTFTFEILQSLLSRVDYLSSLVCPETIEKLEKSLSWAEANEITGALSGWKSNHLAIDRGAEAWSTAAVLVTSKKIRELIDGYLHNQVCAEFHAKENRSPDNSFFQSKDYYDSELVPDRKKHSLKKVLFSYFINPRLNSSETSKMKYSAVFFGPPGTGKTTLAENVAKSLGWPYIYLQTSDFTGDGFDKITGNARVIFNKLGLLKRGVVLFDEVEEFVRSRDDKELPVTSKMLTTTMLSLIQELGSKKQVIFIVATNYLGAFDEAIKREGGRFEMLLQIGPPSIKEKVRLFCTETNKVAKFKTLDVKQIINDFIDSNPDLKYYNLHEWKRFTKETLKKCDKKADFNQALLEVMRNTKKTIIMHENSDYRSNYEKGVSQVRI